MPAAPVITPRIEAKAVPVVLRMAVWVSVVIAAAAVIRRLFALASPASSGPPDLASLDETFRQHAVLTVAHIVPALIFVVLAAAVLFRKSEWAERLLFPIGAIVGMTAYAMSAYSIGGWVERSAVFVFDTIFLYSLWRAFQLRQEPAHKRRWMIRAIVVLLGIATTRPVMGVFFATSRVTHLTPAQFFGIAFWIGFSINLVAVEVWLRKRNQRGKF
jgi:hypothetical protein